MTNGPVVATALYDAYTVELQDEVKQRLSQAALEMANQHSGYIASVIRGAYDQGLRDGFSQGVAAAHRASEEVA